jgi:hypothetical protein
MGCHTWFYKKLKTPSNEVMYKAIKDYFDRGISLNYKLAYDRDSLDPTWHSIWESIPPNVESYESNILHYVKSFGALEDKKEDVEWLMAKYASIHHDNDNIGNVVFIEGRGLYHEPKDDRLPHDLFRVWDYPEDMLFSYEESIQYINNPNIKCEIYENTFEDLKEFWDTYPDGMICFG